MNKIPFLANNSMESLKTLMDIWQQGAIACPINPRIPVATRHSMLKDLLTSPLEQAKDLATLLFTSGSSGKPKIVGISYLALLHNARSVVEALELNEDDSWQLSLPLYHVGGIATVVRCMLARAKVGFDGRSTNFISLVPTQLFRMLKNHDPLLLNKKAILVGGAPVSESLLREANKQGIHVLTTWGMTETSSMVTLNGYVLAGREVKIAEDGEILVRGKVLFEGYLQENGKFFRPMTPDNWFATGDLGVFVSGKLHIKGRKDRLFISYGENVQPEEIENEILKIAGMIQCVVIPVSDPEVGTFPVAFVETEGKWDENGWKSVMKERLASFKVPRHFFQLNNNFSLKPNLSQLATDVTHRQGYFN